MQKNSNLSDEFNELTSVGANVNATKTSSLKNQVVFETSVVQNALENLSISNEKSAQCISSTSNGKLGEQDWLFSESTIKQRIAFMFKNEHLADIHFLVGNGSAQQRIPAHKFVLSIGSAVFNAMFNGSIACQSNEIEVPDVEPDAFLTLLGFLYSDDVNIGPETVMATLYAAKKYAVSVLETQCVEFLQCNLSPNNAFMLLTQARLFDEEDLVNMCLGMIDKNTEAAIEADGFLDVDIDTLKCVIKRDSLHMGEVKLFRAIVRWADAECRRRDLAINPINQNEVLRPLIHFIRFPLMSVDEFAAGPAQSGLLTDKEVISLFLYFVVNPKPSIDFVTTPRCVPLPMRNDLFVNRFQEVEMRWGYNGPSDRIRFIVDRQIYVLGFGLYGSIYIPSEYQARIELIHTPTKKVLASNVSVFSCDGTPSIFRVMFEERVLVLPNNSYTASVTMRGLDSHYGTRGLHKVQVDTPKGGKVTFQFSDSAGDNNGTSVEDGQIPQIFFCISDEKNKHNSNNNNNNNYYSSNKKK